MSRASSVDEWGNSCLGPFSSKVFCFYQLYVVAIVDGFLLYFPIEEMGDRWTILTAKVLITHQQ